MYHTNRNSEDKEIASPSLVYLYDYNEAKGFDKEKSVISMGDYQELKMPDGSSPKPKYESDTFIGVNTINNVKNGKYIITVFYKPSGFSLPIFYYYGYKVIEVNDNSNMKVYDFVFTLGENSEGKFIEF